MSRTFQCRVVPNTWLEHNGRRLDCGPYMSGAVEAKELLKKHTTEVLANVTEVIFHAGREGRIWVDSPEYGVPFMGSTDILASDLSNLPLISKKQIASNPKFTIGKGWTLITRSGTVGRMAYARPDMDGVACSEHVMRVVPKEDVIKPGYLYAYLSSRFGVPIVVSGTYGAIIQHIEPHHIADLPVPRLGVVEEQAHELVQQAADLRTEATKIIEQINREFESDFGLWDTTFSDKEKIVRDGFLTESKVLASSGRFEATFHNAIASEISSRVQAQTHKRIDEVCTVKKPGMFKRVMVDGPEYGYGFIPGSELFTLAPKPIYWVSPKTPNIEDCVMSSNWILIQAFGQIGGLIGRCMMTTPKLEGCAATDLQIQLRFENKFDAGYVFAVLYSRPGYKLIIRTPIGGSIPHINPKDIESVCIPWPNKEKRYSIGNKIIEAWSKRDEAVGLEDQARSLVECAIEEGAR